MPEYIIAAIIQLAMALTPAQKLALLVAVLPQNVTIIALDQRQTCFIQGGVSDFSCLAEQSPNEVSILNAQQVVEGWTNSTPVE
jgi:hypothetical protein